MADTGWVFAGSGADNATGPFSGTSWTNPGNVTADDNTVAVMNFPNTSTGLFAGTFGLSVPGGATIDGVEVRTRRLAQGMGSGASVNVRLAVASTATSDSSNDNTTGWAGSEEAVIDGSPTDLWGESLTDSICNAAGFGYIINVATGGPFGSADVDSMEIKVHYTAAAGGHPASKRMQFTKHGGNTPISRVFQP